MSQNIANWTSFLQSESARNRAPEASDPVSRIVAAVQKTGQIPLKDLATATNLPLEDLLQTIETLRAKGEAEVVEMGDTKVKFLRLTAAGYVALTAPNS